MRFFCSLLYLVLFGCNISVLLLIIIKFQLKILIISVLALSIADFWDAKLVKISLSTRIFAKNLKIFDTKNE